MKMNKGKNKINMQANKKKERKKVKVFKKDAVVLRNKRRK